jgi:hypothetical protein
VGGLNGWMVKEVGSVMISCINGIVKNMVFILIGGVSLTSKMVEELEDRLIERIA